MSESIENVLFCIDSSSFIYLHRFYPPDFFKDIWSEFEGLFDQDKIISHIIVFEELTTSSKNKDDLTKWIIPKRKYFKDYNLKQVYYVSQIINRFPGLIDPDREKDQADPWLIALAIEEQSQLQLFNPKQKVIVVNEESKGKPQRIPDVCNYYGLENLNLLELFKYLGWDFVLRKK
jgi:hypothetical protein